MQKVQNLFHPKKIELLSASILPIGHGLGPKGKKLQLDFGPKLKKIIRLQIIIWDVWPFTTLSSGTF